MSSLVRRALGAALALPTIALALSGCAGTPSPAASAASAPPATLAPGTRSPTLRPTESPAPSAAETTVVRPGESWIAFQTNGAAGYGVYLIREDGTGLHHWPSGIAGGYEHPDWSPDGARIMVNSIEMDGTEDIWSASVDGSDAIRHVDCVAPCIWADEAAWSPDGQRIAFQRLVGTDDGLASTLEILDLATDTVTVVLTMPALEVVLAPRWSPDARHVVVEVVHLPEPSLDVDPDGGGIGVVDLTAVTPVVDLIVPFTTFAQSPDWSPDGRHLLYAQPSPADAARLDLHVIAPDGSGERRLTDLASTGASAIQPAYAPDGERIVFLLTRPDHDETVMALVDIDGGNVRPAAAGDYRDGYHPRLRPVP